MDRRQALTLIRAASVVLVLAAIVAQAITLANAKAFDWTRFFAYFTIQSNLVGVAVLGWLVVRHGQARSRNVELARGAAAVYLTVTFLVVIVLLGGVDVQLQLAWVDFVLHKLFPVIVVLDWIVDPPRTAIRYRDALVWLVYPIVWTALTIIRGAYDGWYPYPFLDPVQSGGYGAVVVTVIGVTIGFLVIAAAMVAIAVARRRGMHDDSAMSA